MSFISSFPICLLLLVLGSEMPSPLRYSDAFDVHGLFSFSGDKEVIDLVINLDGAEGDMSYFGERGDDGDFSDPVLEMLLLLRYSVGNLSSFSSNSRYACLRFSSSCKK